MTYTKTIQLSDNVLMVAYCRCVRCGEYGTETDEEINSIKLVINDIIEVELHGEIHDDLFSIICMKDEIDDAYREEEESVMIEPGFTEE